MSAITKTAAVVALPLLMSISVSTSAGLIYGPSARTQFEGYQAALGDSLVDFDSFAAQTNLTTQIPGLTFRTTLARWPSTTAVNLEVNVICSPSNPFSSTCTSSDGTDRIIGGVRVGGITDGQSVYEIVFDTGVLRAGLERIFNTSSLTRFYSGTVLLGTHQNTANTEFVGFLTDAANPITRIEIDGLPETVADGRTVYMTGYANDLFFGSVPIPGEPNGDDDGSNVPSPPTWLLILAAWWLMRRKKHH